MPGKKEVDAPDPQIYGFNPISHHYVKRSGPGMAEDPELLRNLQEKALARKKASDEKKSAALKKAPSLAANAAKSKALRAARKLVASNRSELADLESDAVDEKLSKVMAKRL